MIKLTRAKNGLANLAVRHHRRHDRSLFPFPDDTAISSGSCVLENNQRGILSSRYQPGPYATTESSVDDFVSWYLRKLTSSTNQRSTENPEDNASKETTNVE